MKQSIWATAALMLPAVQALPAQQYVRLHNGQKLVIEGRILPAPAGRLQFVTLATREAFLSDDAPSSEHAERSLALTGYHDYALLYRHSGDTVVVSGTVMTEAASPYYRHGILLKAASIRTPSGADLIGTTKSAPALAADLGSYIAVATLSAELDEPWTYRVQNSKRDATGMLQCSSNGGGDVVNCSCALGFHPTAAQLRIDGKTTRGTVFNTSVQFEVGGEKKRQELIVTCVR